MCKRDDAAKVQLIGAVPFRHRGFGEWFGRRATGVCHANIDPAKMAANIVDKLSHTVIFSNVECRGVNFHSVQPPRFFCDKVQGLCMASADGEMCAFGGESQRRGTTNSFAGCGNNGDTISKSGFHRVSIKINSIRVLDPRGLQPG